MLPHGYVDLYWAKTPEDTLKPLTGPKNAGHETARELDLFPRTANPEHHELIYKEISKANDKRLLLHEVQPRTTPIRKSSWMPQHPLECCVSRPPLG